MKNSILFWGFQDVSFIAQLCKKFKSALKFQDFYIQIHDTQKSINLAEIFPEEVIRTKCDLNNLYQWLLRYNKNNIVIFIDIFPYLSGANSDENNMMLGKILELPYQFYFLAPKVLNPQQVDFIENQSLNALYEKTLFFTGIQKSLMETVINSGANVHIIYTPILDKVIVNNSFFNIFYPRINYFFITRLDLFKKFQGSFIDSTTLASKIIQVFEKYLHTDYKSVLTNIEPNLNTKDLIKVDLKYKLSIKFYKSAESYFGLKKNSPEILYLKWLVYLSLCEYKMSVTNENQEQKINDYYFQQNL